MQACLELLALMASDGLVTLPAKQIAMARTNVPVRRPEALQALAIAAPLATLQPVTVDLVPPQEQALFDATMAEHHPLGFRRPFGPAIRYWIHGRWQGQSLVLGAMLYGTPAHHVAVRDNWLGWSALERRRQRHHLVAQSRFLILPGVAIPHLASYALARSVRRLGADWHGRFGYELVAVETFVTPPWRGTCYRAANWLYLGRTTGQGRQDRRYEQGGTVREVFVYPLVRDPRQALAALEPKEEVDAMITAEEQLNAMTEERIRQRYEMMAPFLDEKQRRLLAGAEAISYGAAGPSRVGALVGLSSTTVSRGVEELRHPDTIEPERVRRSGGGRRKKIETDPDLRTDLERLVSPQSRGDPMSPLRWTTKSLARLAAELSAMKPDRKVSTFLVATMLHEMGYSLQANRKTLEGNGHHDRDEQFQHIHDRVEDFQARAQPVISVDCKKKELVGNFKNGGREWQRTGQPERVNVHDFPDDELGKVAPYGVYDPVRNEGWVNVGTDHDTAAFAVASIRGWWQTMGRETYPGATQLLITADGGGSNGSRCRLWKIELQKLADESGLSIAVSHFPPGTSKWNKIEHHLFSRITQNWRGRPLTSHEVIVNLIASTTTTTGLKVRCQLDQATYPTGIKISDAELDQVHIEREAFHGDWNYVIHPRTKDA